MPQTYKRKRSWSRAVFSNLQRKGLEKRFEIQKYVTKPDRKQLAAMLGLTDAQVSDWLSMQINSRFKLRKKECLKWKQLALACGSHLERKQLEHCDTRVSREMKVNYNELLQMQEGCSCFVSKHPNLVHWARVSVLLDIGNDTTDRKSDKEFQNFPVKCGNVFFFFSFFSRPVFSLGHFNLLGEKKTVSEFLYYIKVHQI